MDQTDSMEQAEKYSFRKSYFKTTPFLWSLEFYYSDQELFMNESGVTLWMN